MVGDIDRRREEIKRRVLKKSMRGTSAYIGVALIVAIFAFLILTSYNYGGDTGKENDQTAIEKNSVESAEKEVAERIESSVEEEKGEALQKTEEIVNPPVPEGFNEASFEKISIADDSQAAFWSNLYPTSVYFEDSSERVSGETSLKVVFLSERPGGVFAEKVFNEFQNWSNAEFVSFWFKGNNTGLIFDVYIYFNKKWSDYVVLRFQDAYEGWVRFIFSTEKNIIKNGNVDWSKVWRIRIANNNRSFVGSFYFDDFSVWVPKESKPKRLKFEAETYGLGDTITKNGIAVTLKRWHPAYVVKSYAGRNMLEIRYSAVEVVVENVGEREVYLTYTPYKPVLIDDDGKIYEYADVKIRREDGIVVRLPEQLDLGVLYPGTSRSGLILFQPVVTPYTDKVRFVLYLNNERFEFVWDRSNFS